jgi:predicted ATPase
LTEAARLLAGSADTKPLGEVELKDFPEPETVHQLVIDGLRNDFPELRTARRAIGNVRSIPSLLVGRLPELQRCARLLDESRLVTITGLGEVGKTRLAHRLAEEAALEDDGAWFVELAATGGEASVLLAVVAGLGLQVAAEQDIGEAIVDSLRSRRLLLVLDNCEHVLDEVADLVEEILARCDQVRVLTTSREGLGLPAERVFPLRSIADADAVRLFFDRASAAGSALTSDDRTVEQITQVCKRLDGIPLAIELAAARTTTMTVGEIAGRLDERFRLLTGSRRRSVERHQTLRAAVEWSHELLDDVERAVFAGLGVFVSDFDLGAAEAVCEQVGVSGIDVYDGLAALVDKSLLVADTSGAVSQYRMLETLRQYALEQLMDRGALDSARRVHVEHYAEQFEQIRAVCGGPREHTVLPMWRGSSPTSSRRWQLRPNPVRRTRFGSPQRWRVSSGYCHMLWSPTGSALLSSSRPTGPLTAGSRLHWPGSRVWPASTIWPSSAPRLSRQVLMARRWHGSWRSTRSCSATASTSVRSIGDWATANRSSRWPMTPQSAKSPRRCCSSRQHAS